MSRVVVCLATVAAVFLAAACGGSDAKDARPNILLILTDDQRFDTVGEFMPETQARIFDAGVMFTNAFATTPICCPSRASILTGMYAHTHGVNSNQTPLDEPTLVDYLKKAGYVTGQVGKYLNSWTGYPRPEFDFWVSSAGGGHEYFNAALNVNGESVRAAQYITDALRDYALAFLEEAAGREAPFLLLFSPNAPHPPAQPAPEDANLYADLPPHRPPSYDEDDMADKPRYVRRPPMTEERQRMIDALRLNQLRSLRAVDRAIAELLDTLEEMGELENTVVFFTSDNGYLWGEHRLEGKAYVYEPSVRVPFAVRYPKLVHEPRTDGRIVANIDIAPTIYELAGVSPPQRIDGMSLVPLLTGTDTWRSEVLFEAYPGGRPYYALRTDRYVYIETQGDLSELYDLRNDPDQLENRVDDPAFAEVVEDLQARLKRLLGAGGPSSEAPNP